jgi:chitin-binding protein
MNVRRKFVAGAIAVAAGVAVGMFALPGGAMAHGAMLTPGSRTYLCYKDGLTPQGNIQPNNPACAAAVAQSGTTPLYNWFGVLRSDGGGRTTGFIPDGQLCSGGNATFAGYNLPRADWPVTHLTSGASFNFSYNMWAAHPGTFHLYITNGNYSPTRALAWSDLESTPFLSVTNPPTRGSVGTENGAYLWTGQLPAGKSGRQIIYSVWTRSDSQETFYGCSDVVFDGGNGNVTGVGSGGTNPTPTPTTPGPQPTTPRPTTPGPTTPGPTTPGPTTPGPGNGACTATFSVVSSWSGAFQGEVKVSSTAAISNWTVNWAFAGGQSITQLWGGLLTASGANQTVKNQSWNGSVTASTPATFGFQASGTAPTGQTVSCSST